MGKGSKRRPSFIPYEKWDENWARAFSDAQKRREERNADEQDDKDTTE